MSGTIENALPWPYQDDDEKTTSSETTPGGKEPTRWVAVGVNFSPGEAAIIKGRLESQDIPAVVQQEAVGVVFGLTVGPLGAAKVLVPEPLVEQALAILADTYEVDQDDEEDDDSP